MARIKVDHPARYSPEVIEAFERHLLFGGRIHDPFAGTGERLGALADKWELRFSGTELEPSFIVDRRVKPGNAKHLVGYPRVPYVIVTSPVYPNGVADSWKAQDTSRRRTYRDSVKRNEGADRELHIDNMGRYGYRGTKPGSRKRLTYWDIARQAVHCWYETGALSALVNVSDFMSVRNGVEPVVREWTELLESNGFEIVTIEEIETQRNRDGANRDVRVETESLIVAKRRKG